MWGLLEEGGAGSIILRGRLVKSRVYLAPIGVLILLVDLERFARTVSGKPPRGSGLPLHSRPPSGPTSSASPAVMLLDEPLTNLDANLREEMHFELKEPQRKFGFTIIYITHNQAEAMALSDLMLVMNHGVSKQIGKPLALYYKLDNRFVFSLIGLSNFVKVDIKAGEAKIPGLSRPVSAHAPEDLGHRLLCRATTSVYFLENRHDTKILRIDRSITPRRSAFVASASTTWL